MNGAVDYYRRQNYFSRWAGAAERYDYVVPNHHPFLPGASKRTVGINVISNHIKTYKPMQLAATSSSSWS